MCKLFNLYLTEKTLIVRINKVKSGPKTIAARVPQGSVLGPKLYTLYTKDLSLFQKIKIAIYADDTPICSHSDTLQPYYKKWKLTMNADKT